MNSGDIPGDELQRISRSRNVLAAVLEAAIAADGREEVGLLGSQAFVENPPVDLKKVVAKLEKEQPGHPNLALYRKILGERTAAATNSAVDSSWTWRMTQVAGTIC